MEIIRALVEAGADIRRPNHFGGTCLINSVQVSHDTPGRKLKGNYSFLKKKKVMNTYIKKVHVENSVLLKIA